MKTLYLILALFLFGAASAHSQTLKALSYNTTNGQVVYSGTNTLTFTNALQFSTNVRAETRTNLGGTTLGNAVFTATNIATAQIAIFGTNVTINNSTGVEGISLSDGQTKLLSAISFPFLGGATAAATSRTNLGLGATSTVTFSNLQLSGLGSLGIGGMELEAPDSGLDFAFKRTGVTNMVLRTNGLVLHVGSYSFSGGNTNGASTTRTNIGLGATWLTNSASPLFWTSVPASTTNSGTSGQVAYTNNYLYICISNNTWRRVLLGTW